MSVFPLRRTGLPARAEPSGPVPPKVRTRSYSVVVPAFNEEQFLGECLDSLQHQDFRGELEIIVVDNNSTDRTAEIARTHGVQVLFEPEPGVCGARQLGTTAASGEVILSVDADTVYPPTWLSTIDKHFDSDPRVIAVAGPPAYQEAPTWGRLLIGLLFGAVQLLAALTGRVAYISAANVAFKRSAWSGYNTELTQGGDEFDLLRQLRSHGRIVWDKDNPALTSSRRMYRGFLYNVTVTLFYYYLGAYAINKIAGRRVLGMAPSFRSRLPRTRRTAWLAFGAVVGVVGLAVFGWWES